MKKTTQKITSASRFSISFICSLVFITGLFKIAEAQNLTFRSQVFYPSAQNGSVWGYVDSVGSEYALVGVYEGLSIVNVTDPDNAVELFLAPTSPTLWHEIKTWNNHAYVSNEAGGGILIVDLNNLPDTISYSYFTDGGVINTVHALWIDENGFLYLFGSNVSNGGAEIYDLNGDPENPVFVASYNATGYFFLDYIHDGYVRGDTLWASHIYAGNLEVVDMSDKLNPVPLATFSTPNNFTHNSWPTSDNHYVFTTDEVDNSYLASYDVSDLSNVTFLQKVQSNPGSNAIVHNVHLYNDSFAVTAYYTEGVVLWDVTYPDNMVKVGQYDESSFSGGGYKGNWGAYPWLPSGNLLISDIEEGLFVLTPTYVHAAWLYGVITDSASGALLNNVTVNISGTQSTVLSSLSGEYKTGISPGGLYDIVFSKAGYHTKVIQQVSLESGIYDTLNVSLVPLPSFAYGGLVIDSVTQQPVAFAEVEISDSLFTFLETTDATGNFLIPAFYEGTYQILVGKWGHKTKYFNTYSIDSATSPLTVALLQGYYDDFSLDFGWVETGNAILGKWVRAKPIGTELYGFIANPYADVTNDYSDKCFVTGNSGPAYDDDPLYYGYTELISPEFDISQYVDPYLDYYTWYLSLAYNDPHQPLEVYLVNDIDSVLVQSQIFPNVVMSEWVHQKIRVKDFITPSTNMSVHFSAQNPPGSFNLFECGVDKFQITDSLGVGIDEQVQQATLLHSYPNPFSDNLTVRYELKDNESDAQLILMNPMGVLLTGVPLTQPNGIITFRESSLPPGIYFLQLRTKDGVIAMEKVMKQ